MAIVFDTQAELEAFCEAFELRNAAPERKTSRKFRLNIKSVEHSPAKAATVISQVPIEIAPMPYKPETEALLPVMTGETPVVFAEVS